MSYWKLNHPACGGVSFYMTVRPEVGKPIYPEHTIYPDGHRPEHFDLAMCGTCGEYAQCIEKNLEEVIDDDEIEMIDALINLLKEEQ